MKIAVKDIPPSGLDIDGVLEKEDFTFEDESIECISPVKINARLECLGSVVSAKVSMLANFSVLCGRCLQSFESEIEKDVVLHYELEKCGNYIELGEDVRQEILLDFPSKILCSDDCKGICVHCGTNLNDNKCECKNNS